VWVSYLEEVSVSNHSVEDLLDKYPFIWVLKLLNRIKTVRLSETIAASGVRQTL
jgi:TorA maturation chaperone TorD